MKTIGMTFMAVTLLTIGLPLHGQDRWSVEFSAGPVVPAGDLGDLKINAGLVYGGSVAAKVMPHLAVYAGWNWAHFSSDEDGPSGELDVEETGYVLGLRFEHPLRGEVGFPKLRVQAGGTFKHIEVENEQGVVITDSGHGLGWEAGLGLVMSVAERLTVTPGVRVSSLTRDLDFGPGDRSVDLRYVAFELGLGWSF